MDQVRWLSDEEQKTWRAFLGATRLIFDELDRELQREAGMPHGYYVVLVALSEAPGRRLRMTDLAAATASSCSRLSHAVARLEEAGWVERQPCPSDRRSHHAALTAAGLEVLAAAAPGHVEGVRRHLFDRLTPAQLGQLRDVCEAVLREETGEKPFPAGRGAAHRVDG